MSKNRKASLFEDFERLVCAGATWMILNIEAGEPSEDGLWTHLSNIRNNICNSKPSVVKALVALRYIARIAHLEGLYDIMSGQINLRCFFEGRGPDINDLGGTLLVPDSWIVLRINAPDNNCMYKIFSSWFENEQWRLSSGDTNLNELIDLGSFFVWKQKSGSVYRLIKSHADRFCPYAKSVLDNKFLEPAARANIIVELLIDEDLEYELIVRDTKEPKGKIRKKDELDKEFEVLFEKISSEKSAKAALRLFTQSEQELAATFKPT